MEKTELQKMRSEGLTFQEIAIRMGVSRQRIHQLVTGYKSPGDVTRRRAKRLLKVQSGLPKLQKSSFLPQYVKRYLTKIDVLTYYGNGRLACVKCGFENAYALTIDHMEGNGSEYRRNLGLAGKRFYVWLKRENYPPGYQTLCMNCQFIKRFEKGEHRRPKALL